MIAVPLSVFCVTITTLSITMMVIFVYRRRWVLKVKAIDQINDLMAWCVFTTLFPPQRFSMTTFSLFCFLRGVRNNQQQQTPQFTMDNNTVYVVHKHPQSASLTEQQQQQQRQQQQQQESEFDMDHNPLYILHTRPQHKNIPSADHEYETVQPLP